MTRLLFICHGNICRSPLAEYIMRSKLEAAGVADRFEVVSAATSMEEIGNPVYPPVRRLLATRGIDCSEKKARRVLAADYDRYDFIIGMDMANIRNLNRLFDGDPKGKVKLLMEYAGEHCDVADPWYTRDFDTALRDIERGCDALLTHLLHR
ncbi:MAG: low molecular weight phosphotyrosine protein phosphatase [Bacteroidales bacterium]|nr:low molecular weight phosphotyrosine protein phosphatase [Bacteroidales bacterium]